MKPSQCSGRVGDLHHELEALQREMSDPDKADDMDRILDRFGQVQEEYEHLGGYALESQAREVLHGLGFKDDQIEKYWVYPLLRHVLDKATVTMEALGP